MRLEGFASQRSNQSPDEVVIGQCHRAKGLEWAGEYEAARIQLADRWERVGARPNVDNLGPMAQAELLLRAGTLSGWVGSAKQMEGAQEAAKDLISESARIFAELGLSERVADAQVDLATCYWRAGALDEARITLNEVLSRTESNSEPRLRALANLASLEKISGRYQEALKIQLESSHLFEASENHALRGNFHNVFAQVLKGLGVAEKREDYIDRALVEYAAASFHFEQAGHARFQGRIENNLACLFSDLGRYEDAYDHLNRAKTVFTNLKDKGMLAHVDESLAKTLLAEGRSAAALETVSNSVRVFEEGDEYSALAEALTTQSIALARLKRTEHSLDGFKRAMDVAQKAGDDTACGLASLAAAEELAGSISTSELQKFYRQAESLLPVSQNPGVENRLGDCARKILACMNPTLPSNLSPITVSPHVNDESERAKAGSYDRELSDQVNTAPLSLDPALPCSLEAEVLRYEGSLIKRALESSGGSVTRAARLLGTTHQGLAFILNGRQRSLMSARKPVRPRRKSIIRYH